MNPATLSACPQSSSGKIIHTFNLYNAVGTNTLTKLTEALGSLDSGAETEVLGTSTYITLSGPQYIPALLGYLVLKSFLRSLRTSSYSY